MNPTTIFQGQPNGNINSHSSDRFEVDVHFGEEQSKRVAGDPSILENFLFMFYDQDNETAALRQEIYRRERDNEQNRKSLAVLKEKLDARRIEIHNIQHEKERVLAERQEQIATKKVEIKRIKGGDYSLINTDKSPANRPAYWASVVILSLLTLYLICFYASVIYNAFLLDPIIMLSRLSENGIIATITITNVKAFPMVYQDYGILGVIFLLSSTFVFITLGFLLYWFSQSKRSAWQYALYIFTFLFDVFLAYEIVRKIHLSLSLVGEMPEWQFKMAFQQMEFYIIIFAGFGIYIAWGLLLKYVLEEYHKILPALAAIRRRRAEISRLQQENKETNARYDERTGALSAGIAEMEQREVGTLKHDIEQNETQIAGLRQKMRLHLQDAGISAQALRIRITAFLTGWCNSILQTNPPGAGETIHRCNQTVGRFYETIGLN